jgi:hypothetical protein
MSKRGGGHFNSLKHGAFAQCVVLPGENKEEFEELYDALLQEWSAVGISEEQAVFTLAQCVWQKRRAAEIYAKEVAGVLQHEDEDQLNQVSDIAESLGKCKTSSEIEKTIKFLPDNYFEPVNYHYSQMSGGDPTHIASKLKERLLDLLDLADVAMVANKLSVRYRAKTSEELRGLLERHVALEEKLEARMEKAVKRLAQTRMARSLVGNPNENLPEANGKVALLER